MHAIEKMANLAKTLPELRQSRSSGHLSINGLLTLAPSLGGQYSREAYLMYKGRKTIQSALGINKCHEAR